MDKFIAVCVVVLAMVAVVGCASDTVANNDKVEKATNDWTVPKLANFEQMITEDVLRMVVERFARDWGVYPYNYQILYRANWDARDAVQDTQLGAQSGGRRFMALYGEVRTTEYELYQPTLINWRLALLDLARDYLSDPVRLKAMYAKHKIMVVKELRDRDKATAIKEYLISQVIPVFSGELTSNVSEEEWAYLEGFRTRRTMDGGCSLVKAWTEIFRDFADSL